mmetsp:Transcript_118422/g.221261  ORF Transcript_118422/g.221261 Transcript_118422/m.221261 type:complete len:142 (-) Transcript_118422:59-484(-)
MALSQILHSSTLSMRCSPLLVARSHLCAAHAPRLQLPVASTRWRRLGRVLQQRQLQQPLHLASSGAAMQTVNAAAADIANSLGASAATSRVDRSRSPTRRPTGEPGLPLPPGWEEHWSEEHRLPYFWNHVTGQSIWERPQH